MHLNSIWNRIIVFKGDYYIELEQGRIKRMGYMCTSEQEHAREGVLK